MSAQAPGIGQGIALSWPLPVEDYAFGSEDWKKYVGDVGEQPPLPANIQGILTRTCPFSPGKLVLETHGLIFIPATIDGKNLTLGLFTQLSNSSSEGRPISCQVNKDEAAKEVTAKPYWALVRLGEPEPGASRTRSEGYDAPVLAELIIAITAQHFKKGTSLYMAQTQSSSVMRFNL